MRREQTTKAAGDLLAAYLATVPRHLRGSAWTRWRKANPPPHLLPENRRDSRCGVCGSPLSPVFRLCRVCHRREFADELAAALDAPGSAPTTEPESDEPESDEPAKVRPVAPPTSREAAQALAAMYTCARWDAWLRGRLPGLDTRNAAGAPECGCVSLCEGCWKVGRTLAREQAQETRAWWGAARAEPPTPQELAELSALAEAQALVDAGLARWQT